MNDLTYEVFKLSSSGFCCSQIMLKLALDQEETSNKDLLRSLQGLCGGIGGRQKTCGVLTGGIALLGLYAGKGSEEEFAKENFSEMIDEYYRWFELEFESTECLDIIGVTRFDDDAQSYQIKCGNIISKSYLKLYEILSEYGYELGNRE